MMAEGFFIEVGAKVNEDSFSRAKRAVEGVTNSFSRLIGTARNVTAAVTGIAIATGQVETAELKTAQALGISTRALDQWKVSANIAGVNANALVGSMVNLEQKMQRMKTGKIDQELARNLSYLGIGDYQAFAQLDPTERMGKIFDAAKAMGDQQLAAVIINDMLGAAGADFYQYLRLSGKEWREMLSEADKLIFTTEESKKKASAFNEEWGKTYAAGKSVIVLAGSEIGEQLTPLFKDINEFIATHGDEIASGIENIAEVLGFIFTGVEKIGKKLLGSDPGDKGSDDKLDVTNGKHPLISTMLNPIKSRNVGRIQEKLINQINQNSPETWTPVKGIFGNVDHWESKDNKWQNTRLKWNEISGDVQKSIISAVKNGVSIDNFKTMIDIATVPKIKDGIIRPHGGITQVAPDDWVFAIRNISDLAGALMPVSNSSVNAPQSFVINQTLNIEGSVMPGTVKDEAYRGANMAFREAVAQSSMKMQMMTGLR